MQQVFTQQKLSCFNRWTRASFAVFNSIGKLIKISGLATVITASFLPVDIVAQEEKNSQEQSNYYLEEIELIENQELQVFEVPSRVISVVSSQELKSAPIESVQDILNNISQLDLRQRGNNDVQADISIRGGTFDQVLVMLNGINITNPQTGHHNLNLPISFDQIERVEILNGAGSLSFGANAYSGVVNIITKSPSEQQASVKAIYGENNLYNVGASVNLVGNKVKHYFAVNRDASDGYIDNTDFERTSAYYNGKLLMDQSYLQWQLSFSDKEFGAQSFYTAKFPNQFEATKSALASMAFKTFGKVTTQTQAYWNIHTDRFELFRNNENIPNWYTTHNYHFTNVIGGNSKVEFASILGKTTVGLDLRYDKIMSNVLGEDMGEKKDALFDSNGYYDKQASRLNTSLSLEQSYKYKGLSTIIALMVNNNSAYSSDINFYPGVDVNYQFNKSFAFQSSFNKTLRLPTYTDLYYAGPANIGNPDLIPEEAINFDFGFDFNYGIFSANVTSFNSFGKNSIDWVRQSSADKWQPQNLTDTKTFGVDINTNLNLSSLSGGNFFIKSLTVQYTYIDKVFEAGNLQSNYVNDILKHKFVVGLNHQIFSNLSANWKFRYQERNGNYLLWDGSQDIQTPYGDYNLLDARLIWSAENWSAFVDVKNVFDIDYVDYGNVMQPGRWISVGVKAELDF
jgi:vitamin B12 transporter